jgi:hypothetical protein
MWNGISSGAQAAYQDFGSPKGAYWPQEPENQPFVRDWPTERPAWWLPPPGLRGPMAEWLKDLANLPDEHPDWSQWIPPYEPGKPWPWRKVDAERPEDAAGAHLA